MALVKDMDGEIRYETLAGLSIPDYLTLGMSGTTLGAIELQNGPTGTLPGEVVLYSSNGTPVFLFADDDGTIKTSSVAPLDDTYGDTPTASKFVGTGSTTTAVDLATAEVDGTLPAASVGAGITDSQVLNNLTISGGTVDNTVVGGITPAAATITNLDVTGTAFCQTGVNFSGFPPIPGSGSAALAGFDTVEGFGRFTAHDYDLDVALPWLFDMYAIILSDNVTEGSLQIAYFSTPDPVFGLGSGLYSSDGEGGTSDLKIYATTCTITARVALAPVTEFTADDTTPDVSGGNLFTVPATWTAATNITTFDGGVSGQTIKIRGGDSDCIVEESATVVLDGSDWTAAADKVLTLTYWGDKWIKDNN
jgi:hypothetical protein